MLRSSLLVIVLLLTDGGRATAQPANDGEGARDESETVAARELSASRAEVAGGVSAIVAGSLALGVGALLAFAGYAAENPFCVWSCMPARSGIELYVGGAVLGVVGLALLPIGIWLLHRGRTRAAGLRGTASVGLTIEF
jgi:hypothetical protein